MCPKNSFSEEISWKYWHCIIRTSAIITDVSIKIDGNTSILVQNLRMKCLIVAKLPRC